MPRRVRSLDGLRGVAALVVVVCHTMLCGSVGDNAYFGLHDSRGSVAWWLGATPLRLLWDGNGAVFVFFILSGYVLTLQMSSRTTWAEYYAHRAARLYIPAWFAIGLACIVVVAVPRVLRDSQTLWVNQHHTLGVGRAPGSLPLTGAGTSIDPPLWSLRYEVIFSALLPAYLVLGRLLRQVWAPAVVGLVAASSYGAETRHHGLHYLPMFGVGVLLAVGRDDVAKVFSRFRSREWWIAAGVVGLLLADHWAVPGGPRSVAAGVAGGAELLGMAALLVLAVHWAGLRDGLQTRPLQWLGTRSFSLYLVHEPIVVSLALLFHGHPAPVYVLALPVSLAAADVFFRLVEGPANTFAKRVGATAGRLARRPAGVQPLSAGR